MRYRSLVVALTALLAALVATAEAGAQAAPPAPPADAACDYGACALGIAPRWNGLAVVRGIDGRPVANLGFFLPRDVSSALRGADGAVVGSDSAAAQARRALRLRRIGALLTDAGIAAVAIAALRSARSGSDRRGDAMLAGSGGLALALSVPLQFAADGALSRAVWWHNRRFAR